jgi:hypothetical protein
MTTAIYMSRTTERIARATLKVARKSEPPRVTETVIVDARAMPSAVLQTCKILRMLGSTIFARTIVGDNSINFAIHSFPTDVTIARIVQTDPVTITI